MGSDSRHPRPHHRFGFSGPLARENRERVTTDDILASLTRQAELGQKLAEKDAVRLEEIAETEELSRFQGFNSEPAPLSVVPQNRSLGHLVFFFMLLAGLTVVWLYSSISKPFDLASLNGIVQRSGVQSIFANEAEVGIITLVALIGALWIRRRRRVSSLSYLSTRVS